MVKVRAALPSSNPMPITAKLSRKFYDKLGDDVANELVDWFNQVDATYRDDLRELNELNFARFRAEMESGFARADAKVEQRLAGLRSELRGEIAELRGGLAALKTELVKWMFLFWVGTALTVIGLLRP
ncbi:MAG TPA: hypothetical protein VGQ25_07960 [Gemmatimonadales bacterium]|jgi:hypothetical protein|nr:hypothetical protein [Gemmatimonadales bacterium]